MALDRQNLKSWEYETLSQLVVEQMSRNQGTLGLTKIMELLVATDTELETVVTEQRTRVTQEIEASLAKVSQANALVTQRLDNINSDDPYGV